MTTGPGARWGAMSADSRTRSPVRKNVRPATTVPGSWVAGTATTPGRCPGTGRSPAPAARGRRSSATPDRRPGRADRVKPGRRRAPRRAQGRAGTRARADQQQLRSSGPPSTRVVEGSRTGLRKRCSSSPKALRRNPRDGYGSGMTNDSAYVASTGSFERDTDYLPDRITREEARSQDPFEKPLEVPTWPAEPGRYRLVAAKACP